MPGVIAIVDGAEVATVCKPWVATLGHLAGMKSAPQHPLAIERACWQGEPVVAVVAETRAEAEDALQVLDVEWEDLPVVVDMETALDAATPLIHPELGDNLCFARTLDTGGVDDAFASADVVAEATFHFGRHTGVPLEPRCQIADWNAGDRRLTVYHSQQAPHMMQDLYARQFDLPESSVRVICRDVGGSFGIKVHAYPDDFATVALSILLKRPIKFVADRLESFTSDIHAREHRVKGRIAATRGRRHRRVRDRRPDRHRSVLDVPAHQRDRGQPGRQPRRRPVPARALPREARRWCSRTRRRPASTAASVIRSPAR